LTPNSGSQTAAVTFDLWRTLIFEFGKKENSERRRGLRTEYSLDALESLGEQVDRQEFFSTFVALSDEITSRHDGGFDQPYLKWVEAGLRRIDSDLPTKIGSEGIKAVGDAIDAAFMDSPPTLLEGAVHVLDELASQDLQIGLISNTGLTSVGCFVDWFGEVGLNGKFGFMAFSNELEIAKPAKGIFETTLSALDVAPHRTLHVGDNLHADVAGAANVGLATVWVTGDARPEPAMTVRPNFTVDTVNELLPVVDQWLGSINQ